MSNNQHFIFGFSGANCFNNPGTGTLRPLATGPGQIISLTGSFVSDKYPGYPPPPQPQLPDLCGFVLFEGAGGGGGGLEILTGLIWIYLARHGPRQCAGAQPAESIVKLLNGKIKSGIIRARHQPALCPADGSINNSIL